MPTYAYQCTECGHAFDAVQSFADEALSECPSCGGALRKRYGSVGVTFKGSGFYRTDSRSSDAPASGSSTKGEPGSAPSAAPASPTAAAAPKGADGS